MTDEGYACRFSVEGMEVAQTIINLLSRAFAFQTSDPIRQGATPSQRIFRVAYGAELTQKDLVRLLSPVPGLRLQVAPIARNNLSRNQQGR
ncbi:hypothetical protein NG895_20060 [Aeoliella sp. ICT_H6.2]|uniref:Uncharacterized protein n=1 Tax=Aeoliella straminimaris TaxID=2954799 RepID=A0A9X2JIY3_9BACT|nr:hypothetical protein [Aeoliella straminimaris]MCO6046198.1 hypothetical protein [Aeoliella straminimaris]